MAASASFSPSAGEEWLDGDFDLPEGEPLHAPDGDSDKEDEGEDWDVEMDFGKTGGAKIQASLGSMSSKTIIAGSMASSLVSRMQTIRPPRLDSSSNDDDDEALRTIKATDLPKMPAPPPPPSAPSILDIADDDFEDGFALPSELTRLSLRPLELNHRASKSSMEWGDKDHTTSSQSSDTYSTFGFADHSPPSTVYTSASQPETEEEEDDESDDLLDGLLVPSGLFESGQSARKLTKLLETKKKTTFTDMRVKIASPDPEEDFESGLVLDDDVELSPSRLLQNAQQSSKRISGPPTTRSKSVPPLTSAMRPPSRVKTDRAKSPNNPPVSSVNQFRKLNAPPSPPRPTSASRAQTYSQAAATILAPSASSSFLTTKVGLRGQKSHSGLKPVSPPPVRQLSRKASMPSLSDKNPASSSGTVLPPIPSGYNAPTASSRAKAHANSTSRMHTLDFAVPPTRPSTPSSNPTALRLTMPTSSLRMKSRTPISAVFGANPIAVARSTSPLPPLPRPPSNTSNRPSIKTRHVQSQSLPGVPAAKVLRKPKRQRTYGDGTELDDFEDLPLDREKEGRYRVQPKAHGNRVPGSSYAMPPRFDTQLEPSVSRRSQRSEANTSLASGSKAMLPSARTLKRTSRIDFLPVKTSDPEPLGKKKKSPTSPNGQTRRKPTLIRNLGGSGSARVVGEMKWNPLTLRWEGNDQALREFDATVTSTRPALITHLTGSSMGSPVNSLAAGARKVGNMIFDPSRMCWISTLPPEEEEPDVFANMADDEDSDDWESKADTIRASQQLNKDGSSMVTQTEIPASVSRARSRSESESDRCSRASMVCDVEEGFFDMCRAAEQRHRHEMRGWTSQQSQSTNPDRSFLYEIRALATRQY